MKADSYSSPGREGGNLEDMNSRLTLLEPQETPFFSSISKESCSAVDPYVVADVLRKPRINGTKEGDAVKGGNNKLKSRKRFKTFCQRVLDEWAVSDVQQAIAKRGGNAVSSNDIGASKAKMMAEHKRDMEAICLSQQEMVEGGDDVMQTRGAIRWIQSTAQQVNPVPAEFRPPAASIYTGVGTGSNLFQENQLVEILKSIKQVYGSRQELEMYAGDDIVSTVDNFSRLDPSGQSRFTVTQPVDSKTITLMVSTFDCSFARLHVISDQFVKYNSTTQLGETNAAVIVNPKYWLLQFLEDMVVEDREDCDAAGQSGWCRTIFGLNCRNPRGQGVIYGS